MSDPTLLKHYYNLLVTLSKDYVAMKEHAKALRYMAETEASPGRKSGLFCQSKTIGKQADLLRKRIAKNRLALEQMFNTSNIVSIAQQALR